MGAVVKGLRLKRCPYFRGEVIHTCIALGQREVSESSFQVSIRETPLLLVIGLQLILIPQFLLHVEENSNKTMLAPANL